MNNLQTKIQYQFKNIKLLHEALTHKSYANEKHLKYNYERLEFLGDAILQAVTSEYLIDTYKKYNEGQLSKSRVALVCEDALSQRAREMGLNQYIRLGNGEMLTGGRNKASILCDVMESLIGAIYKDSDFDTVKVVISRWILQDIQITDTDYKSRLLERYGDRLSYKVIDEAGKDHEKIYTVAVMIDGTIVGTGTGTNKKQAEQMASKEILFNMHNL